MAIISRTTANQIITDIDVRYPNTYSEADKIRWINDTMKEIYKDLSVQEFYTFNTTRRLQYR